jgi:hypothetical protein
VFKDQKLYDEEYVQQKKQNMQDFLKKFDEISKSNKELSSYITGHNKPSKNVLESISIQEKNNLNSKSTIPEEIQNEENKDNKENLNKNNEPNEIFKDKTELEKFNNFKTFIIQHQPNKKINIQEVDRLSKDGIEINRINSKYLKS